MDNPTGLAQASACAALGRKRPLPAVRLTRTDYWAGDYSRKGWTVSNREGQADVWKGEAQADACARTVGLFMQHGLDYIQMLPSARMTEPSVWRGCLGESVPIER